MTIKFICIWYEYGCRKFCRQPYTTIAPLSFTCDFRMNNLYIQWQQQLQQQQKNLVHFVSGLDFFPFIYIEIGIFYEFSICSWNKKKNKIMQIKRNYQLFFSSNRPLHLNWMSSNFCFKTSMIVGLCCGITE
jgi:hypothetical protein